jgi:hypothetical protein
MKLAGENVFRSKTKPFDGTGDSETDLIARAMPAWHHMTISALELHELK